MYVHSLQLKGYSTREMTTLIPTLPSKTALMFLAMQLAEFITFSGSSSSKFPKVVL